MFEKAARLKLRFNHKGLCSVEDLWDMPLPALDTIFRDLNKELHKREQEESLLQTQTKEDEIISLKVAIVRHVFTTRTQEYKARAAEADRAERKQALLKIIAEKKDTDLRGKSIEELTAMVNQL